MGGAEGQRRKRPPLEPLAPAVAAAGLYATAALASVALGGLLPGGRWVAVHLFTVGVVSNMVMALTHHFAQTLLHSAERTTRRARFALLNAGALLVLGGLPSGVGGVLAIGATATTAAVLWLYWDLRRLRRSASGARFAFVVRAYERACGAFVHGAVLGGLMGTGLLAGGWYGAARLAHLHINVLGWGGLTILATVVFLGPAVMRTRIEAGAVAAGESLLDPSVTARVLDRVRNPRGGADPRLARLTPTELRIVEMIAEGLTNRQIGERIHLAEKTVKNYVSTILTKLQVSRRAEAAAYYVEHREHREPEV